MHAHVLRLLKAVDADESLETFEAILSEDPLLAYRFMLYANSAALGARNPINSLRRALVMLGYGPLKAWLANELVHASHDQDLQPIRLATVMRAQLTSHLLDAGVSQELRSEVYLCGLFARLNELLDEPLETTLTRLPLSERIPEAAIHGQGPYAPSLQLAFAMESEDSLMQIPQLCEQYEISLEHVNRSLLRLACEWPSQRPAWSPTPKQELPALDWQAFPIQNHLKTKLHKRCMLRFLCMVEILCPAAQPVFRVWTFLCTPAACHSKNSPPCSCWPRP